MGELGRVARQDVDVVHRSVDGDGIAAEVFEDAAHEWEEAIFELGSDDFDAVFGAKDRVVEVLRECGHGVPPGLTGG